MNIDKIRSALEFARTRTPAGGPVSSQAESGLMALAEVERELAAARALIERAAKVLDGFGYTYHSIDSIHAELRAFLGPTGEVAYTFGDAPNPPDSSPLPPAVCMKCGDDRNQPSKVCDHGKAAPEPAECGCAARMALAKLYPYLEAMSHVHLPGGGKFEASTAWDALATPCDCAGLREEIHGIEEALGFRGNPGEAAYVIRKKQQAFEMDRNTIIRRGEIIEQLRAELAAMTADRDQWKALKDRVEEEKAAANLRAERAIEVSIRESGSAERTQQDRYALSVMKEQAEADLAATLEREREIVESLRNLDQCDCQNCYRVSAIVAAFDARKEK